MGALAGLAERKFTENAQGVLKIAGGCAELPACGSQSVSAVGVAKFAGGILSQAEVDERSLVSFPALFEL